MDHLVSKEPEIVHCNDGKELEILMFLLWNLEISQRFENIVDPDGNGLRSKKRYANGPF